MKNYESYKFSQEVENALASLELEGIYPSEETLLLIKQLDSGEITESEYMKRSIKQATT